MDFRLTLIAAEIYFLGTPRYVPGRNTVYRQEFANFKQDGREIAMCVAVEHDRLFQTSRQWLATIDHLIHERGPMKLKHIAALMMLLLALGCTQQPAAPAADAGSASSPDTDVAASTTVESETETQVAAATTVKFDVTGMR